VSLPDLDAAAVEEGKARHRATFAPFVNPN
jgi:hypothetical protein